MACRRSVEGTEPWGSIPRCGRLRASGRLSGTFRPDVPLGPDPAAAGGPRGAIAGSHVVIVGRGLTIGRPLANLLSLKKEHANAAVTVVHTGVPRERMVELCRSADVLVAAAGSPCLVTAEMVKPGAAVVAAGVSFAGKKLVSDVAEVAGWLSPRIGGVGPMTRVMLLVNCLTAAERSGGRAAD